MYSASLRVNRCYFTGYFFESTVDPVNCCYNNHVILIHVVETGIIVWLIYKMLLCMTLMYEWFYHLMTIYCWCIYVVLNVDMCCLWLSCFEIIYTCIPFFLFTSVRSIYLKKQPQMQLESYAEFNCSWGILHVICIKISLCRFLQTLICTYFSCQLFIFIFLKKSRG